MSTRASIELIINGGLSRTLFPCNRDVTSLSIAYRAASVIMAKFNRARGIFVNHGDAAVAYARGDLAGG